MSSVGHLNVFCQPVSDFWWSNRTASCHFYLANYNVTSCNDEVDLPICFEDTAILYSICATFWLVAGVSILLCNENNGRPCLPLGVLHATKLTFLIATFISVFCDIIYIFVQGSRKRVALFQYFSPVVLGISLGISAIVLYRDRYMGRRSSGLMLVFWLMLVIYGTVKFRTYILLILDQPEAVDVFHYSVFIIQYTTYLVQLLLSVIPEPRAKSKSDSEHVEYESEHKRKPSPEDDATFLSLITWWWQNGQIWHGWRHTLTNDDLYDLNSKNKSSSIVPQFQKNWNKELRKVNIQFAASEGMISSSEQTSNTLSNKACPEVSIDNEGMRSGETFRNNRVKEPSLVWALAMTVGRAIIVASIFYLIVDILTFVSPELLRLMINFIQNKSEADWHGYLYAVLLFIVEVLKFLFLNQSTHWFITIGMRIRAAIIAAVYNKALRLSNKARQNATVGEIVNLMSVDAQCIMDFLPNLPVIWSTPLRVMAAIVFLYYTLGISIFAGVGVMVAMIPLNVCVGSLSRMLQVKTMSYKDSRTKIINEVLNGIKVIKLYTWEIPFQRIICGIRQDELKQIRTNYGLTSIMYAVFTNSAFTISLFTFAMYTLINVHNPEERLTPDKAFVALTIFNILQFPLGNLPTVISNLVQVCVSIKRLRNFLTEEELDPNNVVRNDDKSSEKDAVSITMGTFTWNEQCSDKFIPTLRNINLQVRHSQLVAVIGMVGSGKSSLIHALLGEMKKREGNVVINGTVAYVPQQAWIQNATLRDNILFNTSLDRIKYERVIEACALEPDLDVLLKGDLTEIGEKGINLSGGQKQRVSLARAIYQDCDIYLLDDPLSAVDAHVSNHIFEKVIGSQGMLKDKVRILVTHGIKYLPSCDVIVMMSDGVITEVGTYSELMNNKGAFAQFVETYQSTNNEHDEEKCVGDVTFKVHDQQWELLQQQRMLQSEIYESHYKSKSERISGDFTLSSDFSDFSDIECELEESEHTALISEEKPMSGNIKLSVIIEYCRACTWPMVIVIVLLLLLSQAAAVGSKYWLADWSNSQANEQVFENNESIVFQRVTFCDGVSGSNVGCYLGIYASLGGVQIGFSLVSNIFLALAVVFASKTLHNKLLKNILRCPMSFFDTTPIGRVLNRFSHDIYIIDTVIPEKINYFLYRFIAAIRILLVIIITTPFFAAVIIPLGAFYLLVQRVYMASSRELKRLESISQSPIYSHFQETLMGASSIRAYGQQERFMRESEKRVDYNHLAYYTAKSAERWLSIRVGFVGNLVVFFAALFAAIQRNYGDEINLPINAGLVGLSISYALDINGTLNLLLQHSCNLESSIVAVERVKEYSEIPTEAPAIIDDHRPPDDWPFEGHVQFNHYSTCYREDLDMALNDISVHIPGGTKVGVVGRTGAGKSSLTLAMFRIIEAVEGSILIDNIDIATFGLDDLRSRITIIPQEPVLFSGTLKMNLDPFELYSDDEIWKALETAHLNKFVTNLEGKLLYPVAEYGENLSTGQRQLVCLARALLRKTKILILDEATAAVDFQTDDLIQRTIRTEFRNCTVIAIAHRLNTIMDYDKVLVLDNGHVVEYGPPRELLANKSSIFYSLAMKSGLLNY